MIEHVLMDTAALLTVSAIRCHGTIRTLKLPMTRKRQKALLEEAGWTEGKRLGWEKVWRSGRFYTFISCK